MDIKNNNMITINLNRTKDLLRLAMLTALTYLLFSITNNYNVTTVSFYNQDTSTLLPGHIIK